MPDSNESVTQFPTIRGVLRAKPSPELQTQLLSFVSKSSRRALGARGLFLVSDHTTLLDQLSKEPVEPLPDHFEGDVALYGHVPRRLGKAVSVHLLRNNNLRVDFVMPILHTDKLYLPLTDAGYIDNGLVNMFTGIRSEHVHHGRVQLQQSVSHLTHFIMGDGWHPALGVNPRMPSPNPHASVTDLEYRNE